MTKKGTRFLLGISLVLVLAGAFFAHLYNTNFGQVNVVPIDYITQDGIKMHAILYIPNSATDKTPASAVVACHGYNNTAEVQDMNSIELSRRGFVVMAIDAYWHGLSGGSSRNMMNLNADGSKKDIVYDMGTYSALQYLGTLPFVNKKSIGMVGHSMGCATIQSGALRAFQAREKDPSVVVPKALLLTSNAFTTNAEITKLAYADYAVNVGVVYGKYDEWAENMWQTPQNPTHVYRGSEINLSLKAAAGMGFASPKFDTYYKFGDPRPLSREEAVVAAKDDALRIIYQPLIDHPQVHFSSAAEAMILDYFSVSLREGETTVPFDEQIWIWKEFFNLVAFLGYFLFMIPFALLLLETPYFKTLIRPEPLAPSVTAARENKYTYWGIYFLCLLPAPLLFYWAVGYPIDIASMGRSVPTVLPTNDYFVMPAVNGLVVLHVALTVILLVIFILTYQLVMKKNGVTIDNLGLKLQLGEAGKALLLALITFAASYALLVLATFFFGVDFRFFVFSIKTLSVPKFWILLKYLPFFAIFFILNSLLLNSFTRIRGASEWRNILLMIGANCGGFLVLFLLDYGALAYTGIKMFPYVPYPGGDTTSALAGMFVWNMLFILPIAAIFARICFRKTGSIWLGGFLNSLVVTLFALSNSVVAAGWL
jgi:dienelactone hydrolase